MIKIASLVLDCYDDTEGTVAAQLPPAVHECKVASLDVIADLKDEQFGLVMKTASGIVRKFPLHDDDSRVLSYAYFAKTSAYLPAEARQVAEKRMNGELKVGYIDVTNIAQSAKVAFTHQVYGLEVGAKKYFPLHDAELVKTAISRFNASVVELKPEHAFVYAREITKRAAQLNVPVPADCATRWYTNPGINKQALAHAVELRKRAAVHCDAAILDDLLAAVGETAPKTELEDADAFAHRQGKVASFSAHTEHPDLLVGVLQKFDKLAGFDERHYRRGLPDPFASCFREEMKIAGPLIDGIDLSTVDWSKLAPFLDKDIITEFQANPVEVYKALPDPIKSAIRDAACCSARTDSCSAPHTTPVAGSATGDAVQVLNPIYANQASTVAR